MGNYAANSQGKLYDPSDTMKPKFVTITYRRIGRTAMDSLLKTAQTLLSKKLSIQSKVPQFIQSLATLRSSMSLQPHSLNEISAMAEQTNEVLASATTVFPLTIFPDTITLDRTKLTITRRGFFSSDVMSIRIEDILNVSSAVGPFFGSLTVATRVLSSDDHFIIRNFARNDVIHMKHMIQGYVIARHNNIICDHLSRRDLTDLLCELGHDSNRDRYVKRLSLSRLQ
ncbi:MAG: hypothetical protein WBB39_00535 [Candidatus Saccharimonadales bacterium]